MSRRLFGSVIVSGVLFSFAACSSDTPPTSVSGRPADPAEEAAKDIGGTLYATTAVMPSTRKPQTPRTSLTDAIVIDDCRVIADQKQEVPAQKDGVIDFIGTPVDEKDIDKVEKDRLKSIEEIEIDESDPNEPSRDRPAAGDLGKGEARAETHKYKKKRTRYYRELREGDEVKEGQMLARLDDRLARDDLAIRQAKINVAKNDVAAEFKTKEEAYQRYLTQERMLKGGGIGAGGATSREEFRGSLLVYETKLAGWLSKIEAHKQAELERDQARTNVELHQIKARTPGMIKMIYKRKGESVRALEPVFQVLNLNEIRVEGLMGRQYLARLDAASKSGKPMRVSVESAQTQSPLRVLKGHTQDITGVAIGKGRDGKFFIVSTSQDRYLRAWMPDAAKEQAIVKLPGGATPTSVACAPANAATNWVVCGDSDGKVWYRNLDGKTEDPTKALDPPHHGPVTCVAISPDGIYAASGGDDRAIRIWNLNEGKHLYTITDAHTGIISTLQFTPKSQLLSAARDNCLCVWALGTSGAKREMMQTNRSGDVPHISASPDGTKVLFDYAKELQVLSIPQGLNEGYLLRPSKAASFTEFALFSPDGDLILTSDGSESQVQLWRAPAVGDRRGYEVRKLISEPASAATCAAFSPDGNFVATGHKNKDLCIWKMPNSPELTEDYPCQLDMIDPTAESSDGKVRVRVRVLKPGLTHNTMAQLVIDPAE
jgi:WD40 repeat protein